MLTTFSGVPNYVYPDIIKALLVAPEQQSRNGITREIHPCILDLTESTDRLVTSFGRPVNVAFALAEVLWILSGRRDVPMLEHYNKRISAWADDGKVFNAPYGYRLRTAHGHDQIQDVIRTLQNDPESRQAVLNVWLPEADRGWDPVGGWSEDPKDDEETWIEAKSYEPHRTEDRACNMLAHLMIRDGALDWMQVVRSNDAVWGVPYNWMQWSHLHEYIAAHVAVPVGRLIWISDSMHIYGSRMPGVVGDGSDDTMAWEEAEAITAFDLYHFTGYHHRPMGVLTEDQLKSIMTTEATLRTHPDADAWTLIRTTECEQYWKDVLEILYIHTLYVEGKDHDVLNHLHSAYDRVYALAQMRFYWSMRWSKGAEAQEIREDIERGYRPHIATWVLDA